MNRLKRDVVILSLIENLKKKVAGVVKHISRRPPIFYRNYLTYHWDLNLFYINMVHFHLI